MKAVFIGCVEFSRVLLEKLLARDGVEISGVVSREESPFNADFRPLAPLARAADVTCLNVTGNDQAEINAWVRDIEPNVIFCFGWSYLLNPEILSIPEYGVIGYHPALLPRNRGRHPIVWALALGLEETGSTFFVMDDGADSGDIVSQRRVAINGDDDAGTLYEKLLGVACAQLDEVVTELEEKTLTRTPQDSAAATYWRKRDKSDGKIDWRMPAAGIHNLVRALTRPYVGAHCLFHDIEYKVWKAATSAAGTMDVEPGRVLAVDGSAVTVKSGDGAVTLIEHELTELPKVGDCL